MTTAYATLVTSDLYIPGALVLAASLKQHSSHPVVALVGPGVTTALLEQAFDRLFPVVPPAEALFPGRPELSSTYAKLEVFRLPYARVVYLDADVLPLATLDGLMTHPLQEGGIAAAPDAGWPDIFNLGVLVVAPNEETYSGLVTAAAEGALFDGADQGLLNTHFEDNWTRLPYVYNVTPSTLYEYAPAHAHFKKAIKAYHFAGAAKPWALRTLGGFDAYDLWWAKFDEHYGHVKDEVLGTRGEAYKLSDAKAENAWDAPEEPAAEEPAAIVEAPVWKGHGGEAERVFGPHGAFERFALE